jgi:ribosome-binding protein aMBF1 (putative translation factor)
MAKFDGIFTAQEKRTPPPATAAPKPKKVSPTTKAPTPKRATGKRSDPDFTQITAYVRKDTHQDVMQAIYKQREFSDLIQELLAAWLKKQK